MMKRVGRIVLSLIMIMALVFDGTSIAKATNVDDMNLIKSRIKEYFLKLDTIDDGSKVEACYVSHAEDYLKLIEPDGSFKDVDYKATNNAANGAAWSPYLALDRMQAIAIAYNKQGNSIYKKQEVVDKLNKAIVYWASQNPRSTNWWENQVGVQLRFARIGLFMEDSISSEALNIILNKLLEKTPVKYGSGQNNLWFDQNYVYYALIKEDATQLKDMISNYLDYCLTTQLDDITKEAVQVDNSYYMHGRQFYSNGYGMTMFRDMSYWIYMLKSTDFAVSQDVVDRMGNYMINGTSWTVRGDIMELYLGYRPYKYDVGYDNYSEEYIEPLKRMIESDTKRASEYQKILDNIEGKNNSNGKNGNYYMWRSGYESHMRDGYGVNIKMDSKNLIGGEWRGPWNEAGKPNQQLIYWTSAASSTITVDGDEYKSVYPVFDWTHTPGATAPNFISNKFNFENNELFNIGVSNGKYGVTAYKFDKTNTKGQKGYFFFDDEFVALGSNISSTNDAPIHTTLNQSKASDLKVNGEAVELGTVAKEYTTKSIYNNKIGYVFLKDTKVKVSYDGQKNVPSLWPEDMKKNADSVFTAYIDHGVKPTNDSYAYIVVPNKTEAEVKSYSNNIPVTVVANNSDVQAVRHDGLKQTQINFYKAGSLEYKKGYTITVDQACSVIIDESGSTRQITVAVNDNEDHKIVNVGLSYNSTKTTTTFISKALPYAGQSKTLAEGQDDRYLASSSTANHYVKNVVDGNSNTYWESKGQGEEWISLLTGSNKYLKDITISWGEKYASEYEVYASQDGENYELVSKVSKGDGKQTTIPIARMCNYIKIIMKSSSGDCYQIKEVAMDEGELLSLNKPTTTSSVSSKAPTFVGGFAVDGDLSTRWASNRNSDNEWIIIDLEKYSRIDAMKIIWENACSDDYTIEVSDDNQNWKSVKQLKADVSLKDEINFSESVYGRYVKINSHKSRLVSGTNYGINIFEINVYGEAKEEDKVNVALNKPSKASSEYINPKSKFTLESKYAFDGSVENKGDTYQSRWVSERGKDNPGKDVNSQYIQVDLEEVYDISRVVLNWEGACGKEYKIQISEDGQNWIDVSHITDGVAGIKELNYEKPVTGRYVKMLGIIPIGQYGYSLWEFEVYGTSLKSELKKYYDQNKNLDTSSFTPNSIEVYNNALDNITKVYEDKAATSTEILNAKKQLEDAINNFVLKANKATLDNDIKKAELIEKNLYTDESIKIFEAALNEAKAIFNDDNATQKQVDDDAQVLEKAMISLEKKKDDPVIEVPGEKIDLTIESPNKDISVSGKLPKDIQLSSKALDNEQLKEVVEKIYKVNSEALKDSTLEKVYDLSLLLKNEVYKLDGEVEVSLKLDDSFLSKKLGIVYIDETGNLHRFESKVENGFIKFNTPHFSKYGIVSTNDLILEVDKAVLDNEIKKAQSVEKDLYTNESIRVLDAALNESKAIYNDADATQKQVDDEVKALQQALLVLEKKKDNPIVNVPAKNTEVAVQNTNKNVNTSENLSKDIKLIENKEEESIASDTEEKKEIIIENPNKDASVSSNEASKVTPKVNGNKAKLYVIAMISSVLIISLGILYVFLRKKKTE
ncbi:discoidin domain-containing protein [Clostridium fungisolvens]|nr:discoidin domain-containing protein [Clostridium fungisolvens]